MGKRGEIDSIRVFTEEEEEGKGKTYFFNIKENRYKDLYLNIAESRADGTKFKRTSLVVFFEDIDQFLAIFQETFFLLQTGDKEIPPRTLKTSGGRREYTFRVPSRTRKNLQITEDRVDASGRRKESIWIESTFISNFSSGLEKAVDRIRTIKG